LKERNKLEYLFLILDYELM